MALLQSSLLFLFFVVTLAAVNDHPSDNWRSDEEVRSMYLSWAAKHGKTYKGLGEQEKRFNIFKDNLRFIDQHNSNKSRTYDLGLTIFADLTNEEYRTMYVGKLSAALLRRMMRREAAKQSYAVADGKGLPERVDWRERGAVTPIKTQLSCNGCWAFATVAAIEGINKIKTGKLISLSEQQLIDCDRQQNTGCNGGVMDYSFVYLSNRSVGLHTEQDYPFIGKDGQCDLSKPNNTVVTINGLVNVPQSNEMELKKAVAQQPCTVSIDISGKAFQHYSSGVVTGECDYKVNHGVVAIGYGTENGVDYWLLKNSWGGQWGENGFFKIQRNVMGEKFGKCGITLDAAYPVKN